ncbi:MAG: alpha/beta hydrolase [Pseudomonadota bacterium]|nr:alpha/beta hydrolase [Pseudomonadota bacterium]
METYSRSLVLLPGLLCDGAGWSAQREALGHSTHCTVADYGAAASIRDMAERALSAVPQRFALAGHSMGGRVALEMVRLAPERVERIALLDTGIDPVAAGDAGATERAQRNALLRLAQDQGMRVMGRQWARRMVHPDRLDTPLFDTILDMIERKTTAVFEVQIEALLGRPDARSTFATLRIPTLLLCGREDAWSRLARHEQMHALLPTSRLVVVEHSGHMTTMEQPEAVTAALLVWLEAS